MSSTSSGLIVSSRSTTLTATKSNTTNTLLQDYTFPAIEVSTVPTLTMYESLTKGKTLDVYFCRIAKIHVTGAMTFFDTVSTDYGSVSITLFGLLCGDDFEVGDTAIFFNLVHNSYNGKVGLKFGSRTAMFHTDGVSCFSLSLSRSKPPTYPSSNHQKHTLMHL